MFRINWNKDKVGYLNTWVLLAISLVTVVALIGLIAVGISEGNWATYATALKGVIIAWWVLSMVSVLVRIAVYRVDMVRKREKLKQEQQDKVETKS